MCVNGRTDGRTGGQADDKRIIAEGVVEAGWIGAKGCADVRPPTLRSTVAAMTLPSLTRGVLSPALKRAQ
jgi:hypothetical protein